jgi:streptogramin lyase
MRSLFNKVQNAQLGVGVTSEEVTLSGLSGAVSLTINQPGVILYRNGGETSTPTTVSNGDRIRLAVTAPATYATTKFVTVNIGGEPALFSVTTIQDPAKYNFAGFSDLTPLELTKYQSGQDYIPNPVDNVFSIYGTDGNFIKSVPAKAPATNGTTANDFVIIADYYSDKLLKIDAVTHEVVRAITVGARPYGLAHTPTSDTNAESLTWVSVSEEDKVLVLDKNHNVVATHRTGEKPLGIAVTIDGRDLFVANNAAGTVTHFTLNGDVWSSVTVNVGAKPFEVATDLRGNAWVTCTGTDKVYRITRNNVVTPFIVGGGPRGVLIDGAGMVWVACSQDNTLVKLNPGTGVKTSITTRQVPVSLTMGKDGTIYVANFGDSTVQKVVNGAITATTEVGKYPYGLTVDGTGKLWVASLYSNTPAYLYDFDQTPLGFAIQDQLSVRPNTLVTTNTITVTEINTPTPVAVPDLYGATIIKNGADAGSTTTVVSGDTLAFKFTTPNVYDTQIDMPIFVGTRYESFTASIPVEDRVPNPFLLIEKNNAEPDTWYTSNEITVTGIDSTATIPVVTSFGTLVIDRIDTGATSASARLGTKVAIRAKSSITDKQTLFIDLDIGTVRGTWRLTTNIIDTSRYIKPEFKNNRQYHPGLGHNTPQVGPVRRLTRIKPDDFTSQTAELINNVNFVPGAYDIYVANPSSGEVFQFNKVTGLTKTALKPDPSIAQNNVMPFKTIGNRFVLCGANKSVYDILTGKFTPFVGPGVIKMPEDGTMIGQALYVTTSNGEVHTVVAGVGGEYFVLSSISVGGPGTAHAICADQTGALWVSDIVNDRIYKIFQDEVVATIENAGADIWSMKASATHLWTANSYDNTVSKINLSTLEVEKKIRVASVPNNIEIDQYGKIWVSHYYSKNIIVLDPNTDQKVQDIALNYAAAMEMHLLEGEVWVSELYSTIDDFYKKTSGLNGVGQLGFAQLNNVKLGTVVSTDTKTIAGLVRPTVLSLQPNSLHKLYVNGVQTNSATVDNGDTVQLEFTAPTTYDTASVAVLSDPYGSQSVSLRTEPDIYPEQVFFIAQFDAMLRQTLLSNTVSISGVTPGATITLKPSDARWSLVVNGVLRTAGQSASVLNGDTIALTGPAFGQYGTTQEYKLLQAFPAAVPAEPDAVLGTFVVTNKELDGPVPAASKFSRSFAPVWIENPRTFGTQVDLPEAVLGGNTWYVADNEIATSLAASVYHHEVVSEPAVFERNSNSITVADVDRVFESIGAGNLHEVEIEYISQHRKSVKTVEAEYAHLPANTLRTVESSYTNIPANTLRTVETDYVKRSVRTYHLGDAVHEELELEPMQFNHAPWHASPESEYEQRKVPRGRVVEAEYELRARRLQSEVEAEYEVRTNESRRFVEADYVKHASDGLKISPLTEHVKSVKALYEVEVEYIKVERKSLKLADPIPVVRRLYSLNLGPEIEWQKDTRLFIHPGDVVRIPPAAVITREPRVTEPMPFAIRVRHLGASAGVEYVRQVRHVSPTAEVEYVRQVRHVSPGAETFFDKQVNHVSPTFEPILGVKLVRRRSVEARPELILHSAIRKKLVTIGREELLISPYKVYPYSLEDTATMQGAYATANEAIAAGIEAGWPFAYAVPVQGGVYIWATQPPKPTASCGVDPNGPGLYPRPEKWYVHGG